VNLREQFETILGIVRDYFPNARLAYLASRIYAGYAITGTNPEPWAYENGFTVKWLIEAQLGGDPGLNYDPDAGPVESPWLSWGVYTWADGVIPRSDGLTWICPDDFQSDGTHPTPAGSLKVATLLMDFLKADPVAEPWFLGDGGPPPGGFVDPYCFGDGSGTPCPCGASGAPGRGCPNSYSAGGALLQGQGTPSVSADDVVFLAGGMPSASTVLFFQGFDAPDGGNGVPFGDGLRCVGGDVIRLAILPVPGHAASYPGPGEPAISELGLIPPEGGGRYYQAWYRDPAPGFCTPATFNFTNALHVVWAP
jgi:hypothetical protein